MATENTTCSTIAPWSERTPSSEGCLPKVRFLACSADRHERYICGHRLRGYRAMEDPRVIIERDGKELRARVDFEEPALDDRLRAAEALSRVRVKTKPGDPEYDAMIARAAGDNS